MSSSMANMTRSVTEAVFRKYFVIQMVSLKLIGPYEKVQD